VTKVGIFKTADGRKFETVERAIQHADRMRSTSLPEYIWRLGKPYYVLLPDGKQSYFALLSDGWPESL
jgi:hypothetical protein